MQRRQFGRASTKSYTSRYQMNISQPEFKVLTAKSGEAKQAKLNLTYKTLDRERNSYSHDIEVSLPVVCLWVDPEQNEAVKAHVTIDANDLQSRYFYSWLLKAQQADTNRFHATMSASSQAVMRYGQPGTRAYKGSTDHENNYNDRIFYDTKTMAFKDILDSLTEHQNIGGVNIASFSHVPDELLLQVGFTRVSDIMGRGIDMWQGEPRILKDIDGDNWTDAGKKRISEMMMAFLDGLRSALQS